MITNDALLIKWAEKGQRTGVSLGQLVTLLELSGQESVAAMAPGSVSHAVNYRQKLDRLEKALGIGRLTKRVGNVTQVSELGQRVAGEVRLLLMELSRKGAGQKVEEKWVFGAGDTWLQSVVIPTLARWPPEGATTRWHVTNLRSHDVCDALREGRIHFGLLRNKDLPEGHGLTVLKTYSGVGLSLVISGAPPQTSTKEALRWVLDSSHPLIQQGTTWQTVRGILHEEASDARLVDQVPAVVCETHPQAASSVINGRGWSVVPTIVARNINRPGVQVCEVTRSRQIDDVVLVVCERVLEKLNGGREAANALKQEIGLTIAGAKK